MAVTLPQRESGRNLHRSAPIRNHRSLLNFHPCSHSACSFGWFDHGGHFHPCADDMDFSPIEDLFRERTLKLLLEREATTPDRSEEITSFCRQATS